MGAADHAGERARLANETQIVDTGAGLFVVRHSRFSDVAIVAVAGEIDMATAPDLARAVNFDGEALRGVIIDLSEVSFLDSSALRTLASAHQELAEREIVLSVVKPADPTISRVFEITQFPDPLILVESLDTALAKTHTPALEP
jgi:anti-sigma B factor antagonist